MNRVYSKETIELLVKKLDGKLRNKVEIIAIGGTALSLRGERLYSKDIDICYLKCKSPIDFTQAVVDSSKEIGINPTDVEMFHGFEMTLLEMPRFGERAIPYDGLKLKNITLKTMHPADMILSKIYRSEPKDLSDSKKLLGDKRITITELNSRFVEVAKSQKDIIIRREFIRKYEDFIGPYTAEK